MPPTSWNGIRRLLAPLCDRCGEPTVIERERLLTLRPAVFEVVGRCPVCATTTERCRVESCAQ